ncbi:MAG: helix-turn-helix domain-containing protein, partial [Clostridiales bacterium]|nr:helix-turn-helix domain-containing protein [Clostridiales bacterium]
MIGERIREIRSEIGMTAKEMAEKADVTPGYISQIERDQIKPSMSVLMRIAEAIHVPLAALFTQEEQGAVTVIPRENRTKVHFSDVNLEYEFLTPYGRNRPKEAQMEIIEYRLDPQSWGSADQMIHPQCAECSIVLEGVLEYHVNNSVYRVEEGGCLYLPPNTPHQLYN